MFNIPVSQTQFGVTHPPGFCDIQNSSRNLPKLKHPDNLENRASFEYTLQTQNSGLLWVLCAYSTDVDSASDVSGADERTRRADAQPLANDYSVRLSRN